MANKLLPLLPAHKCYVEVFGGGASLLLAKGPVEIEVYNDLNSGLVNFFRVLRDEDKFARFYRLVQLTPYSKEEYYLCRDSWRQCEDDVERAYKWFIVARMSFSGWFASSWSQSLGTSRRGMAMSVSAYLGTIERLPEIHDRLMRVQIEHSDWQRVIKRFDAKDTFFYLDPPYVHSTRRSGDYEHEMTDEEHKELVKTLLENVSAKVMLSGYKNEIYAELDNNGWHRYDFDCFCYSVAKTKSTGYIGKGSAAEQRRIESVWLNYELGETGTLPTLW